MTIRDFKRVAKSVGDVVIFESDDREFFYNFVDRAHREVIREFGTKGRFLPCKSADTLKAAWVEICKDARMMQVGCRILDAVGNLNEAYAMSYGG